MKSANEVNTSFGSVNALIKNLPTDIKPSTKTRITPPTPANARSIASAPSSVLVKYAISPPKAINNSPTPVLARAIFKIFIAVEPLTAVAVIVSPKTSEPTVAPFTSVVNPFTPSVAEVNVVPELALSLFVTEKKFFMALIDWSTPLFSNSYPSRATSAPVLSPLNAVFACPNNPPNNPVLSAASIMD